MTHIRIVIDTETLFDGDLEEWKATPPDAFKDMLQTGAAPAPWMKAIMIVMAESAMTGQSVSIEVTTTSDEPADWWSMEVRKT